MKRHALALVVVALGTVSFSPLTRRALAGDLDRAALDRLESEGRAWFDKAGNPDASRDQRNDALREAYTRLKQAWSILDAYCDEHPNEIDALDEQMGSINKMLFWVKKEAPIGVLDGRKPGGTPPGPPPPSVAPVGPEASPPSTDPSPVAATPPSALERARAHQKSRPGDLSGALALWLDVLAASTDPLAPGRAEALARVADLNERLKEAYRELRDDDPDSIQVEHEPGQEDVVAARLVALLGSDDPVSRRRSALELGALGYSPAALDLYQAVRGEKVPDVREALFSGLVRLGGRRTCESLAKFSKDRRAELTTGAVSALSAIAKRGKVQARFASLALGDFVADSKVEAAVTGALSGLSATGRDAVPGLLRALDTKSPDVELQVIRLLAALADERAAPALSSRIEEKADTTHRDAAADALRKIGMPAVPALIDALKVRKTRRYAGIVLYDVTGQTFGEDVKAWISWWSARK